MTAQPKLLSARPRVSAALMQAQQKGFTSAQLSALAASDQSGQQGSGPKKKKRGPVSAALANLKGNF
jgi:hypothetical protein